MYTSTIESLRFAQPSRHSIYVLPLAGEFGPVGVVFRHVALAAAAGGVHVAFDGRGDKVRWRDVLGGAEVS